MQKDFQGKWMSPRQLGHDPACPFGETKLREMIRTGEAERERLGVWAGAYFRFNREKFLRHYGIDSEQKA